MDLKPEGRSNVTRIVGVGLVVALHVCFGYALVTGLALQAVKQFPAEIVAEVMSPPPPPSQPPPPAQNLAQPSVPTFVPPMIQIAQAQAGTTAITAYVGLPTRTAPAPAAPASTDAVSLENTHTIPPYPLMARRMGQQGTVRLTVTVGTDGRVADAALLASSGAWSLDSAALEWVKSHWLYRPATREGRPVATTIHVNVVFDLNNA